MFGLERQKRTIPVKRSTLRLVESPDTHLMMASRLLAETPHRGVVGNP